MAEPKWLELAREHLGEHEIAGEHDNPAIMAFYKDAGHPEIRHDEVAWCAAFACAMMERAGYASPKTLSARDWARWGKKLDKPQPGCIVVFSRGDPRSYQGHVAFWLGEADGQVECLGGNQSDAVSITHMPKGRVLGYRWPVTATNSRTTKSVVAAATGATATAAAGVAQLVSTTAEPAMKIGTEMKGMGIPWLTITGSLLIIAALGVIAWAHWSDLQKNGK